jgi:hypothetical protein
MEGWIDLAQDKDNWRVLVKAVMNFSFHTVRAISSTAKEMLASH